MIKDLMKQREIKDLSYVQEEKNNLINVLENIVGEVDII